MSLNKCAKERSVLEENQIWACKYFSRKTDVLCDMHFSG